MRGKDREEERGRRERGRESVKRRDEGRGEKEVVEKRREKI